MLRDWQQALKTATYAAWDRGSRNVLMVAPTGGGKTVIFCNIIAELNLPTVTISHRQELVGQAALALNREELPHGIIAPRAIIRQIIMLEQEIHGRSFYSPRAHVRAAGVDTLINHDKADPWLNQVKLVVQDEGHHVLASNKWGRAQEMFPNARGLLVTAHAIRGDRKGLGRAPVGDGIVDELVVGPSARDIIDRGFLCDYRFICPPSDISTDGIEIGNSGDFKYEQLRAVVHESKTIVGDVVKHYLKFAAGKLGITFAVDIEAATELATKYRSEGVPAEIITAKTPLAVRGQLMRQFRARQILQLVSVDVLGEGVDVPAVEVVSMARPTASFQLYSQQFGRALRLMLTPEQTRTWNDRTDAQRLAEIAQSVKPKAIIIDHVQNYVLHGLPDVPQEYTLARKKKKSKASTDEIPLRYCVNPDCYQPYPTVLSKCPICGTPKPAPVERSTPQQVEGNCLELDPEVLRQMRREQAKVDGPVYVPKALLDTPAASAIARNHRKRQEAQHELRRAMALWAGWQNSLGRDQAEIQRRFYYQFGIDVISAQALGASDADNTRGRIWDELNAHNIVEAT